MKVLTILGFFLCCLAKAALAQVVIDPSNTAILYSPYNWKVVSGSATSINPGAYAKVLFTGSSCSMGFNTTNNSAPISQIWWRVDGYGPWTQTPVATTIACAIPSDTSAGVYHLLEVVIKSTSETINRWASPSNTAVVLTSLTFATGSTVLQPIRAPRNVLIFGDSITEGVRAINQTATNDTDRNDAMSEWSFALGKLLGAEIGVVGFGATGFNGGGSGGVPALTASYNLLFAGAARSFLPSPDLVVIMEGTNDGSSSTVSAAVSVLTALQNATPATTKIAVLRPFNGTSQAAFLKSAVANIPQLGRTFYVDTAGVQTNAYGMDTLNLHPLGPNAVNVIAPLIAAKLAPILVPNKLSRSGWQ